MAGVSIEVECDLERCEQVLILSSDHLFVHDDCASLQRVSYGYLRSGIESYSHFPIPGISACLASRMGSCIPKSNQKFVIVLEIPDSVGRTSGGPAAPVRPRPVIRTVQDLLSATLPTFVLSWRRTVLVGLCGYGGSDEEHGVFSRGILRSNSVN
eukprot:1151187-Pelagomonas_calceolata.AAC.3